MRLVLLTAALTLCCLGTIYDADVKYEEDYEDAWVSEPKAIYDQHEHMFAKQDNQASQLVERDFENDLQRLRRSTTDSKETKKWRDDLRCGPKYPLEDGTPAQCDPNNKDGFACCSPNAWCGKTAAHCTCRGCIDYRKPVDSDEEKDEAAASGEVENPTTGKKYSLGQKLEPGDFVIIEATYSGETRSDWFSVNLLDGDGNWILHVSVRPSYRSTRLNSYVGGWQSEIGCELPSLKPYTDFQIKIIPFDDGYIIYFDGKALSKKFPYRKPLSTAKYVLLSGGTNGFKWNKIIPPGTKKAEEYTERKALRQKVDEMKQAVQANVAGKTHEEVETYADSAAGSVAILKWQLLKTILAKDQILSFGDNTLDWILSNREALEMFMTSGDVSGDRYLEALEIFGELIKLDPKIKSEPLRLRLAVATALTHSTPVTSMANSQYKIDWRSMYQEYMKLSQEGKLFPAFSEGTAWHLRYVVGSWQTIEEHAWARENTPAGYDNPSKIGQATHQMVSYKVKNDDGLSVHGSLYYYHQPVTLKVIHEVGGVCGAVSKFSAGMCHAYGVPAMPVGQPGHCAYIWYKNGAWVLGNDISGWGESTAHGGIQYTWMRPAYYYRLMEEAQKNLKAYRLSEKLRIASSLANPEDRFEILEDAITKCPQNFASWVDLNSAVTEPKLSGDTLLSALLPVVKAGRKIPNEVVDLALDKVPTSIDCFGSSLRRMTDSGSAAATCNKEAAEFVLDLGRLSKVNEIRFRWWGCSKAAEYDIYAMSEDGKYVPVKSQSDEDVKGWFNHWSYVSGWDMKTTKIKVNLRKGKLDPWNSRTYFGIRVFNVFGYHYEITEDVSKGMSVTANPGSTDPASLVDGNTSTKWNGNSQNSWFVINLKRICVLDHIEFLWADGAKPEGVKVMYKVGAGKETETGADDPFDKVNLNNGYGAKLKVEMSGGTQALKGVKACGIVYNVKDLLKMKITLAFGENHHYVGKYLRDSVDNMKYED